MTSSDERKEIRSIRKEHQKYLIMLDSSASVSEQYRRETLDAGEKVREKLISEKMSRIPVEELKTSRGKNRIRLLRENGYLTVGSVLSARTGTLAEINGISEDGARQLKQAAKEIRDNVMAKTVLRLDPDFPTPEISRLVLNLSRLLEVSPLREDCRTLETAYASDVRKALHETEPLTGLFRSIFSGAAAKKRGTEQLQRLKNLLNGDYGVVARSIERKYEALRDRTEKEAWKLYEKNAAAFYAEIERLLPELAAEEDPYYGLPAELGEDVGTVELNTEGLQATLRRYQELGVKYILRREKVLLGDEMGLGKTVQAIAAMVSIRNSGGSHFLVICPAGVLVNWCREIARFSDIPVHKIHGAGRTEELAAWKREGGAGVTTYETAGILDLSYDQRLDLLVADEAHYIKNPEARRTQLVSELCGHTNRILFMTGTPMENKPEEMIRLVKLLSPELAEVLRISQTKLSAFAFRLAAAPVYYRRKREDVLRELPELVENEEWCELSPEEWDTYRETLSAGNWMEVRRVSWNGPDPENGSKALRLKELLIEAEAEGRKVIVFSYFLQTLRTVSRIAGRKCCGTIHGGVSAEERQRLLDEFEKAPEGSILAAQIQSGGTGLNIQCASTVILCEPQLKPSLETQAISRVYRMGQTRTVMVHRLLCEDTIDEQLCELLRGKQDLFDTFADRSAAAELEQLTERRLRGILKKEQERVLQGTGGDLRRTEQQDTMEHSNIEEGEPE